jgi:hypothetical protein
MTVSVDRRAGVTHEFVGNEESANFPEITSVTAFGATRAELAAVLDPALAPSRIYLCRIVPRPPNALRRELARRELSPHAVHDLEHDPSLILEPRSLVDCGDVDLRTRLLVGDASLTAEDILSRIANSLDWAASTYHPGREASHREWSTPATAYLCGAVAWVAGVRFDGTAAAISVFTADPIIADRASIVP